MNKNNIIFNAVKINVFIGKILNKLDLKLIPEVYIIALKEDNKRIELIFEPVKNDSYAKKIEKLLQKKVQNIKFEKPLTDIMSEYEIISQYKSFFYSLDNENGKISFLSGQITFENYFILILLQLNKDIYLTHYRLKKNYEGTNRICISLLDAAIEKALAESSNYLLSSRNKQHSILDDIDNETQIIRWASAQLMEAIVFKTENQKLTELHLSGYNNKQNFFDDCNMISSLLYEGRDSKGKIIIASKNHPNLNQLYLLQDPVDFKEHRTVRKLLELCSEKSFLLYERGKIYGIGLLKESYDFSREDFFIIIFKKHYSWTLLHYKYELMTVTYGIPTLTDRPFENNLVKIQIKKTFKHLKNDKIEKILDLINHVTLQKHGTILVVSDHAEREACRLKNQAILFKPFHLTKESLLSLTNIDGAIIISPDGKCSAVGVILDGVAIEKGNASRGARYNSAARYIDSQKCPCLAVVVSEDGMVNILYQRSNEIFNC